MNKLENEILLNKLAVTRQQLEDLGILQQRGINPETEKALTFAFVVYSLQKFLATNDINDIIDIVTEGPDDCDIDICHIDTEQEGEVSLNLFQAKFKQEQNLEKTIGANEVDKFLNHVKQIFIEDNIKNLSMNSYLMKKYLEFKDIIKNYSCSDIHINLFFITNGSDIHEQEKQKLNEFKNTYKINSYHILNQYDFFISDKRKTGKMELSVYNNAQPINFGINAYIANIRVYELAKLFDKCGEVLLDRNVRRLLKSDINKNISSSLINEPTMFWYKNNGISIVCRSVEAKQVMGQENLILEDPYIINGGQTTKTIYNLFKELPEDERRPFYDAYVMVRVYQTTDEEKTSAIIYGTNNQNKITLFDLKSGNENLKKIKEYFLTHGITLIIYRDTEEKITQNSINSETLLQAYCAIYKEIPNRAKISRTKITELYYDEVYNDPSNVHDLLCSFYLHRYVVLENKTRNEEHLLHSIYAMLYVMTQKHPTLKKNYSEEIVAQAYNDAVSFLTDLTDEQMSRNESYTHHNFFKSEISKKKIDEKLSLIKQQGIKKQ